MHYDRKILPLDNNGTFLISTHFSEYGTSVEITRESWHAYFGVGHIDSPADIKNIIESCTVPRPASSDEAKVETRKADLQREVAAREPLRSSRRSYYETNARSHDYAALLAKRDSLYVPRLVYASRTGLIVLGIELSSSWIPEGGVLRVVDAFSGDVKLTLEERSDMPKAHALTRPFAFSLDGHSLLARFNRKGSTVKVIERPIDSRGEEVGLDWSTDWLERASFYPLKGGWVGVAEGQVKVFESGTGKCVSTTPLPKSVFEWGAGVSIERNLIALPGDKGAIVVVDLNSGSISRYFPHRGAKRDDFARIQLSDCGEWMVSRIARGTQLMITRLQDGVSWPLGETKDSIIEEPQLNEFASQSHIPAAFGFVGSRLLIAEACDPEEIVLGEPAQNAEPFVSEQGKPGARVPIKVPTKADFEKTITAASLGRVRSHIRPHYSPGIKIQAKKPKKSGWYMPGQRGALDLGVSRFGGWPDLPEGHAWPEWQGRPMAFLALINLADAHAAQPLLRLPKAGWLLFFLGCGEDSCESEERGTEHYMVDVLLGTEPAHRGGWKVLYVDASTRLSRQAYQGEVLPELYEPCELRFMKGGNPFPDEQTIAYQTLDMTREERDNYNEVIDLLAVDEPHDQLMAHPQLLQSTPPEMMCELAVRGRDPYQFPEPGDTDYEELMRAASEWGLLLQLTSDSDAGFMWGDAGNFYFYGKREEMEKGEFASVWVSFEN